MSDLRTQLLDAVRDTEPPVGDGPAAVFARAGRIRARRRALAGLAGVAAVALVAAVAVQASGIRAQRGPDGVGAASPGASSSASSNAGGGRLDRDDLPAAKVVANLRRLLPPGVTATEPSGQDGYAEFVLTDAAGSGRVKLNVQSRFAGGPASTLKAGGDDPLKRFTCAGRTDPPGTVCAGSTVVAGGRAVATYGPPEDAGHNRIKLRMVDVYWPDLDVRVVVAVWNAVAVKTNAATRPEPALTEEQLLRIATDASWRT